MKKVIGKITQLNLYVLLLALFFSLYNLLLVKFNILEQQVTGFFYTRELLSIIFSALTIKLFFKVEDRYKEEE